LNFEAILRQSENEAVETAFWDASRAARTRALLERRPQLLRFDEKRSAFVVEGAGGMNRETFAIDRENWVPGTRMNVTLQKRVPPSQFTLVQGELVDVREITAAHFFPDGTCSPFLVNLEIGASDFTIEIDPWTGAELLGEGDE